MPCYTYKNTKDKNDVREVLLSSDQALDQIMIDNVLFVKLPSIPGKILFKGSGFYQTDYKGKK